MIPVTDLLNGRYRLGPVLGRGGMSDVYRAIDEDGGSAVAVKIVRSGDPQLARRLSIEAKALEQFDHPGLVRLLDAGVSDDQAFLVMELVDGQDLTATFARGPLPPERVAGIGATLAGALEYVHGRGIVHRDVKPANVLVQPDGAVKLGDFGIARVLDASTVTMIGTTIGTVSYMAPEQLEGSEVGPAADIWSLGIVLVECLTGRRVYEGTPSEVVGRRLAGPVPIPPSLPVPWQLLLGGMLDHDPARRLRAGEVAGLLASGTFTEPWEPSTPIEDRLLATADPHDLTALLPAPGERTAVGLTVGPVAVGAGVAAGVGVGAGVGAGVAEPATAPERTVVRPVAAPVPVGVRRRRRHLRSFLLVAALAAALALVLALLPGANVARDRPGATVRHPTTTTTPSAPDALAALVRDVAAGVSAGTLPADTGQTITSQAQQAVADAAGQPDLAAQDLGGVASTIASGAADGSISAATAAQLQQDLNVLAAALGLPAAASPPTTTTTPAAPGRGHGHGQNQGGD